MDHRNTRLQQLPWWDQNAVSSARVIVAGCGALGNEVLKNLLLLGWGYIVLADFDVVSPSNLSRSIFFTAADVGRKKTEVLAERAAQTNDDCSVIALDADLQLSLSSGIVLRADVVLGCIDNVAARLALSRLAGETGRLYIDGGLSPWEGTISIFGGFDESCYACGLTAADYRELNLRRTCPAYAERAVQANGVPTTPTVSSIVAAQMVQLALKYVHGVVAKFPFGRQLRFDTAHERFWNVLMPRNPDCLFHPRIVTAKSLDGAGWTDSWQAILTSGRNESGMPGSALHLPIPYLRSWACSFCGLTGNTPRAHLAGDATLCPNCNSRAVPSLGNQIVGNEEFLDVSPSEMGYPPWMWINAVDGSGRETMFELGKVDGRISSLERSV